jgi:hypothetical protein
MTAKPKARKPVGRLIIIAKKKAVPENPACPKVLLNTQYTVAAI